MEVSAWTRAIDCLTSASRSVKASDAQLGRIPVSAAMSSRKPWSVKVSMPQSVWWIRTISLVPSSRWLIASERSSSWVMTPPALRMTCASPSDSPSRPYGFRRASMQATTAICRAGGMGRSPLSKVAA